MTDAYIEGFCKTAEEHGVDPIVLMKVAGVRGNVVLKALNTLIRKTPTVVDDTYRSIARANPVTSYRPLTADAVRSAAKGMKANLLARLMQERRYADAVARTDNSALTETLAQMSRRRQMPRTEAALRSRGADYLSHPALSAADYGDGRMAWIKQLVTSLQK